MSRTIELTNESSLLEKVGEQTFIKAPVARLGVWSHPSYGTVEFSQKDFDEMVSNWKANVMGHEPPLYLGHPTDIAALGGAPAIGFLNQLVQDGDTLYGLYEPVDKEALADVAEGKYRYSSCEVTRQATSKVDGAPIGTLLTALALTNEPFLTNLPRVEVTNWQQFADPLTTTRFVFSQLSTTGVGEIPTKEAMPQTEAPTPTQASAESFGVDPSVTERLESLAEENKVLRLELTDRDSKIAALSDELTKVTETLSQHTEAFRRQALSEKIARINKLNVSAATKELYTQKLQAGMTPEAEEMMFSLLDELATTATQKFTQSIGAHNETNEQQTIENPYAETLRELEAKAEKLGRKFTA